MVQGFYFRSDLIHSPGCGLTLSKGPSSLIQTLRSFRCWGALDAQQEHSFWFNIHQKDIGFHTSNCSTSQINQRTYGDSWGNSLRTFNTASKCDVDAAIDPHNTLQKTSSHVFYDLLVFKSGELVRNHWKIGDWNVTFWWERQYFFIAGRNVKYSWKWGACVGRRGLWRWILLLLSI